MSCMIAPLPGGSPEIFPLPCSDFDKLRAAGQAAAAAMGLDQSCFEQGEFLGAAMRTDGRPFYLWATAPDLARGEAESWQGGFWAPFGVGEVRGRLDVSPGLEAKDSFAITTMKVRAELTVRGETTVAAAWSVIGSQHTVPNKSAMIESVQITKAGPHDMEDMRRCIALHAPQRALGEPRAMVSMQAGVAANCLIEAIC